VGVVATEPHPSPPHFGEGTVGGAGGGAGSVGCTIVELTSDRPLPQNGGGWVGVRRQNPTLALPTLGRGLLAARVVATEPHPSPPHFGEGTVGGAGGGAGTVVELTSDLLLPQNGGGWVGVLFVELSGKTSVAG